MVDCTEINSRAFYYKHFNISKWFKKCGKDSVTADYLYQNKNQQDSAEDIFSLNWIKNSLR